MAAPKSWSSDVAAVRRRKHFTLDEAHRALPLVKQIVTDIVRTHDRASNLHAQLEHRLPAPQRGELETNLEKTVDRLNDLVDELKDIGVELKDYRLGLIDFVGKHEGREIYLCWKLGEPAIEHWHELQDGIAGRQPVSLLAR